ncbi:efflux RND transporter periplasmic adaptor subunit [Chromobacterium alkanivorans]|uniref:efflux RND transporter periplasmic adaptor subunit n=1 Tax=Chromobacterium alkanivorans TaxID=1071719 RepID=UPI001967972A|nr:efflux RND transporter periplasmic adaptor subunit [Chromobacterium alkanivorans]MBN3003257.1 efflux RND transporter periplasmic adaptor subunit [Chromobacterium alkanivorans]
MRYSPRQLLSLALLLSAPAWLTACGSPQQPAAAVPQVTVETVAPGDVPMTMELVGETAGYRDIEVRARVGGILLKRTYVEGQPVKQGQTLFQIDPAPYQAQLEQAKGAQAVQLAALQKADADLTRIRPLYQEQAVSKMDYDNAVAALNSAKAAKQSADAKVKEAQLNLDYTRVTAPIPGLTSKQVQSEGSLIRVDAAAPLTTISQLNPIYVNFAISEQDSLNYEHSLSTGKVSAQDQTNHPVHIRLADGRVYAQSGKLDFRDNRVDPKTGTISARAQFPNEDERLLPGQFVRVQLDLGVRKNVLTVPEQAVVQAQADNQVMVVGEGDKVQARMVKLGGQTGGRVVIESGLKAGERVIVDGLMQARPGTVVKPVAAAPAKA